jgi:hypothetical protein
MNSSNWVFIRQEKRCLALGDLEKEVVDSFGARSGAPGGERVVSEARREEGGEGIGGCEIEGRVLEGRGMHGVERDVALFSQVQRLIILGFDEEGDGGGDEREELRGGVRGAKGGEGRVATRRRSHGLEEKRRDKGDIRIVL